MILFVHEKTRLYWEIKLSQTDSIILKIIKI